jgi:hypothetical protein
LEPDMVACGGDLSRGRTRTEIPAAAKGRPNGGGLWIAARWRKVEVELMRG